MVLQSDSRLAKFYCQMALLMAQTYCPSLCISVQYKGAINWLASFYQDNMVQWIFHPIVAAFPISSLNTCTSILQHAPGHQIGTFVQMHSQS